MGSPFLYLYSSTSSAVSGSFWKITVVINWKHDSLPHSYDATGSIVCDHQKRVAAVLELMESTVYGASLGPEWSDPDLNGFVPSGKKMHF